MLLLTKLAIASGFCHNTETKLYKGGHFMREVQVTKVRYRDAGSEDAKITSETAFNDKLKKATEAKEPLPEVVAGPQTFLFKFPDTVDEAVTLAGGRGVGEYEGIEVFLGHIQYAF